MSQVYLLLQTDLNTLYVDIKQLTGEEDEMTALFKYIIC